LAFAIGGPGLAATPPAAMAMPMSAMSGPPTSMADWARGAMLFQGLGKERRPVTTASPQAQAYFDQGRNLMWGFNHDEAAADLDYVKLTTAPDYRAMYAGHDYRFLASSAAMEGRRAWTGMSPRPTRRG
jgi:hypothetical protein